MIRSWPARIVMFSLLLPAASPLARPPEPVIDTSTLGRGPFSTMSMEYQRHLLFLKFHVFKLEIQFGSAVAGRIEREAKGKTFSAAIEQKLASIALEAEDALIQLRFLRDIDIGHFLDKALETTEKVYQDRLISQDLYQELERELPNYYACLNERGIRIGDSMFYRIIGDHLRVVYESADGQVLIDQTQSGREHILAVLGGYFVPKSEFRKDLIRSIFPK